jgi:hypothetical protein
MAKQLLKEGSKGADVNEAKFVLNIDVYFFIGACLVIFFDFLQSDWLQQRATFYDILTVVQKSYFLATNRGVKTIFKLKTLPKKFKNAPYRY